MKKILLFFNFNKFYIKKLLLPIVLLVFSIGILIYFPFWNHFFPEKLTVEEPLSNLNIKNKPFATITVDNLYYMGYDYKENNTVKGHYYYSLSDTRYHIYLLSDKTLAKGYPQTISNVTLVGKLLPSDALYNSLISAISSQLNISTDIIYNMTDNYTFSELHYNNSFYILLLAVIFIILLFVIYTTLNIIHFEDKSNYTPSVQNEWKNKVILHGFSFYLTSNYLISADNISNGIIIVPLTSLAWVYKYHKRNIFHQKKYTFNILTVDGNYYYFYSKKNIIEEVSDYIREQCPYCFVGYSAEHAQMVHFMIKKNV